MKSRFIDYFLNVSKDTADLSYAERKKVGCIAVKDDNIIAFGYNGTVSGADNICEVNGVTKPDVVHAEANLIAKLAKSTHSSDGAEIFMTLSPCWDCSKLIIQSGIKSVYYLEQYRDVGPINFLVNNGVQVFDCSKRNS